MKLPIWLIALLLPTTLHAQEPTCVTSFGQSACGYHCRTDSGAAACAQTPGGVCASSHGRVQCFDPPLQLYQLFGAALPRPECRSAFGQIACGYGCVAAFGQLRCAETPAGVCGVSVSQVQCFDPPWQVYALHGLNAPRPECRMSFGRLACGYRCATSIREVRCAQTPAGQCQNNGGQLTCWDPPLVLPFPAPITQPAQPPLQPPG